MNQDADPTTDARETAERMAQVQACLATVVDPELDE